MEAKAAMAAPPCCWSSLPADLVNRVADCLLATNDIDYYSDLRAVCHNWRASTADPRTNNPLDDPRFRPTRWIMLDEPKLSYPRSKQQDNADHTRLFVNLDTGRFLRKSLPLLRRYHLVTSTVGGFLVLADRDPPHAARVLNPFTGHMIRFKAPMPTQICMTADVVAVAGHLPRLAMVSKISCLGWLPPGSNGFILYVADPGSKEFLMETTSPSSSDKQASELLDPVRSRVPLLRGLAAELAPGGEIVRVIVTKTPPPQGQEEGGGGGGVRVFSLLDSAGRPPAMEEEEQQQVITSSIGGRALFVGDVRCISVDAASFPSVQPDCIYYRKAGATWMYHLVQGNQERIADQARISIYPVPVVQLLIEYVTNPPRFDLAWRLRTSTLAS